MNIITEILTSQRELRRLRHRVRVLQAQNRALREKKKPTVADRTQRRERITPERVLSEYLFGKERADV